MTSTFETLRDSFAVNHSMASVFPELHEVGEILHNFAFLLAFIFGGAESSVIAYQNECLKNI